MYVKILSWKTVSIILLSAWAVTCLLWGSPAEAAILKMTARTERPYIHLVFPPKGVDWGCGKNRPVAKTKSGKKFCPR